MNGSYHLTADQLDYDAGRTALLLGMGLRVLRCSNAQVLATLPQTLATIQAALAGAPIRSQ